jgi:hypothetical protein
MALTTPTSSGWLTKHLSLSEKATLALARDAPGLDRHSEALRQAITTLPSQLFQSIT